MTRAFKGCTRIELVLALIVAFDVAAILLA
jgi:hypothetical protein